MLEKTLQQRVIGRAKRRGWRVMHVGKALTGDENVGWRMLTAADPGWPDLFMANAAKKRVLAVELKRELGKTTPQQDEWLYLLNICGIPAVVIRPSDLREGRVNDIL